MAIQSRGFTLLELICVVVIIGLLAAEGVRRYIALQSEARKATVTMLANSFAAATSSVHAQWKIAAYKPSASINVRADGAILIEQLPVFVNAYGWPVNTDTQLSRGARDQSAVECWQLWQSLLQNPAPTSVEGLAAMGERGTKSWHISSYAGAICRFEWMGARPSDDQGKKPAYYFDYSTVTGHIKITTN